jgi:iron complex transport system substrate-binding protein
MPDLNKLIAGLLIMSLSAIACLPASPAVQVSDDSGTVIELDRPVGRIISLAPSSTEMVYLLALEDRLAGVTEYCNYPPEAKNKAKVGGFSTVDVEKAVSLQPDLVLAAEIHGKSTTPLLEKLGFRVVTFHPKTMSRVISDIELLARICGITARSEGTINSLKSRVDAVSAKTVAPADGLKPGTLVIIWHDPMMVAGKGTLIDDLVRLAGGVNLAQGVSGYANLSIESMISADPKVIIIPTSMGQSGNQIWNSITSDARLKNVSAIKNNAVYKIDGDIILRYGPRSVTALEQMAALLHPQLNQK